MSLGKDRMIVALDFDTYEKAKNFVDLLEDNVTFYKVGLELFLNSKGEIIDYLKEKNKKIFLDLKFHDIPNTTAMAAVYAAKQNVFMFNVHASGGKKMMKKVAEEVSKIAPESVVIGVTVLTSLSNEDVLETFNSKWTLQELALNFAKLVKESGLDGVVCSPWEAQIIKSVCGNSFKTVCPGVRPKWSSTDDQERIMTPYDAMQNGCDYLVVGRPITKNQDPIKAANLISQEIEEGLAKIL
ncbi:orotidine-5'-phosphate decarboxylase [Fusobacterium sp. PH5-44]|uniref:orotidine-5'-phosphate decarboxylase n=1 Tax=unclassified Fusobacterium TaxID=2648384 RepID=UPI003D1D74DA